MIFSNRMSGGSGARGARPAMPSLFVSLIPIIVLLAALVLIIAVKGAALVQDYSYYILLAASAGGILLGMAFTSRTRRCLLPGIAKSARQILPAVPILLLIGTLSATWMFSGLVPTLIDYGLRLLSPSLFLVTACLICAVVSVVTGSSWTTIATIGVALLGVGTVMGYSPGWVAGAIISGAYFGDKVSPLSDTTILASSSCGVNLFTHIRFLMLTSMPAMAVALAVYFGVGMTSQLTDGAKAQAISEALHRSFVITPWVLLIPLITVIMIATRRGTVVTLAVGTVAGLIGMWVLQPGITSALGAGSVTDNILLSLRLLLTDTSIPMGDPTLESLTSTGGVSGMMGTVYLVLSAMLFGGVMMGTGMMTVITHAITSRLRRTSRLVTTTVASGLFLNSCTSDQYLSIILGGNVFKKAYRRRNVKPQVLSRTLEDSISVTSVLIPWNSCGVTQSTVLGVATLIYFPFCIFNIMSPVMSIAMAWIGWKLHHTVEAVPAEAAA